MKIDTILSQSEGYILQKFANQWYFVNVIINPEDIPNRHIDALRTINDDNVWLSKYDFEHLNRSQYEDTITFSEMINDKGEIDLDSLTKPAIEYSKPYQDALEQQSSPNL